MTDGPTNIGETARGVRLLGDEWRRTAALDRRVYRRAVRDQRGSSGGGSSGAHAHACTHL